MLIFHLLRKINVLCRQLVSLGRKCSSQYWCCFALFETDLSLFYAHAEEEKGDGEDADEIYANPYDDEINSQYNGYESAEDQDVCYRKDFEPDVFIMMLTAIKSKGLFRRPYARPF